MDGQNILVEVDVGPSQAKDFALAYRACGQMAQGWCPVSEIRRRVAWGRISSVVLVQVNGGI